MKENLLVLLEIIDDFCRQYGVEYDIWTMETEVVAVKKDWSETITRKRKQVKENS